MPAQPLPLQPGDYYYNDRGLMVFTEQYHKRRGYCCRSGCKHCPYGFRKEGSADPEESGNDRGKSG